MKIDLEKIKLFIEKNRHEMLLFWESLVNIQIFRVFNVLGKFDMHSSNA